MEGSSKASEMTSTPKVETTDKTTQTSPEDKMEVHTVATPAKKEQHHDKDMPSTTDEEENMETADVNQASVTGVVEEENMETADVNQASVTGVVDVQKSKTLTSAMDMIELTEDDTKEDVEKGMCVILEVTKDFTEILSVFRAFRDACYHSHIFDTPSIKAIDQIADDIRHISHEFVVISKRVSSLWIDSMITFFENIDSLETPNEILVNMGNMAGDISRYFEIISSWASNIMERLDIKLDDGNALEAVRKKFEVAVDLAKSATNAKKEQVIKHEKSKASSNGIFSMFLGSKKETSTTVSPHEEYISAQMAETDRMVHLKSAEVICDKAEMINDTMKKVISTCQELQKFWQDLANSCKRQGRNLKEKKITIKHVSEKLNINISVLRQTGASLEKFAMDMVKISTSYNFPSTSQVIRGQPVHLDYLKLSVSLPGSLETPL